MANRKLDMGKAWTEASAMIASNRDTIGAIAGLFFFLPSLAAGLLAPEIIEPGEPLPETGDPQAAFQAAIAQMSQAYADNWLLLLAISIMQFIGSLSLLALLSDRARPTVGEALRSGVRSSPSYFGAQLLSALAAGVVVGLPLGLLAAFAPPAMVAIAVLVLALVVLYMFVKFSLAAPVIAIDGVRNPIAALKRSWQLTKGNSFRIVAFLVLLFLIVGIIATLVSGIVAVALAALGAQIAAIGNGVINAAVNTITGVVFLVVIAAVHRQLAGASPEGLAATFE
jgi:flagellar biosynthesis protein FlhB